jgi:hypothetical protein
VETASEDELPEDDGRAAAGVAGDPGSADDDDGMIVSVSVSPGRESERAEVEGGLANRVS